jgi:hypothetical protein
MRPRSRLLVSIALPLLACNDPSPGDGGGSGGGASESSTSSGPGATSVADGTSSGTTGTETTGPPPVECVELEWELTSEAREPSQALAVAVGEQVVVLERTAGDTTRLYLHGMGLDGSESFGAVLVGEATDGDVALLPAGDVVVVASAFQASWISWWSPAGQALDELDLLAQDQPLAELAVLALADGSTVVGGTVESKAGGLQEVLQRRSPDGDVSWELLGEHDVVLALALTPEPAVLALSANRFVEGFESFLLAHTLEGAPLWSVMAGSEGGNFNQSLAPYALAEDGEGGAIIMGSQAPPRADPIHSARLIRLDPEGNELWSGDTPLLTETSSPGLGGVIRVGERFVAISGYDEPTLSVFDLDGGLRCQQPLGDAEVSVEVQALRPLAAGGFVAVGGKHQVTEPSHGWVARFAAPR